LKNTTQQTGAVVHRPLDDRAPAIARAPPAHGPHLAVHRRLVAHVELADLGALGPVEVPARVVLEEVEHRGDAHLGEAGGELGADRALIGHALRRELPERDAAGVGRATRRR